ncbi:MAG: hypothetical protein ABIR91_06015 [Candidatus Saccharimonadales bacterium]
MLAYSHIQQFDGITDSFVYLHPIPTDGKLFYSPNSSLYYPLLISDFKGRDKFHTLTFSCVDDPALAGSLQRNYDIVTFVIGAVLGSETVLYKSDVTFDRSMVAPRTEIRRVEHFMQSDDGIRILVTSGDGNFQHSLRLYIITEAYGRQLAINGTIDRKELGITIMTSGGVFAPTATGKSMNSADQGMLGADQSFKRIDHESVIIVERLDGTVHVTDVK